MAKRIVIRENGLNLVLEITDERDVRFLHFSPLTFKEDMFKNAEQRKRSRLVEIQVTGENWDDHHGMKHTRTNPGFNLLYVEHRDYESSMGRKLEIELEKDGLVVISHIQFVGDLPIVRSWTEVKNMSSVDKGLEYVSSFALSGIEKEGTGHYSDKCNLYIPHNTWYGECQWHKYRLSELGINPVVEETASLKSITIGSKGTWSTAEYLPMGCFDNEECNTILFWQIEHNGSWSYEIGETAELLYLQLSGPSESESAWWKNLRPGETFVSVPVAVGATFGGMDAAMGELTKYRRLIRRPNDDDKNLPLIFNDYANCLNGDPTVDKLKPLIDAAAGIDFEYFCIDAGWYGDDDWWSSVGEWLPSLKRFPNGIHEILDYIRSKGMIPGLWLEIEVMGINCPIASKVSDDWFFKRHGQPVIDHGRYQLDFRNKAVKEYASEVVDRLVSQYKVGYIKMDYNINGGLGTEVNSDSFGDGLLEHNRAYLEWLDGLFSKYPDLVIENCGSGGMRMDYAQLCRHSIQSITDQSDYRKMALIAAAAPTAVTPEQCAVWTYPSKDAYKEEVIFNMVNALLLRVHQSGYLSEMSDENLELIREAVKYYKSIRRDIPRCLPFWPLGLPSFNDGWVSLGLRFDHKIYLAVWRLNSTTDTCMLPIKMFRGKEANVKCAYPVKGECKFEWQMNSGILCVKLPMPFTARIFELEFII